MRRRIGVVLLALMVATAAHAQVGELQPGVKVRINAPGFVADQYEGTMLSRSGDTLVLAGSNFAQVRIPTSRITSLELSRGKNRTDGAIAGLKWGLPIGAAFGLLIAVLPEDSFCDATRNNRTNCGTVTSGDRAGFAALMIAGGAIDGAGIGALIGREHWDRFDLGVRTSLHGPEGRLGLGVRYAF